jgi:hypothetical protein
VIVNTIQSTISGSTLDTLSTLAITSESSEIIRALALGIAGSGSAAVQVTALGNAISNKIESVITASTVNVAGNLIISAADIAPSVLTGWNLGSQKNRDDVAAALNGSPIDPAANILAVNVSVAASGSVAVNAAVTGNVIANTVKADILDHSSVTTTNNGKVDLSASSKSSLPSLSVWPVPVRWP